MAVPTTTAAWQSSPFFSFLGSNAFQNLGTGLQGLGSIGQFWNAMKQNEMYKQQFDIANMYARKNFNAQAKNMNWYYDMADSSLRNSGMAPESIDQALADSAKARVDYI